MSHKSDISIGKDKWINWIDFEPNYETVYLDGLLYPIWEFWKNLQTECVVECCGIDAFSFWPEDIDKASKEFDKLKLIADLTYVKNQVFTTDSPVIGFNLLNNYFNKNVFIELLDHIISCLSRIPIK